MLLWNPQCAVGDVVQRDFLNGHRKDPRYTASLGEGGGRSVDGCDAFNVCTPGQRNLVAPLLGLAKKALDPNAFLMSLSALLGMCLLSPPSTPQFSRSPSLPISSPQHVPSRYSMQGYSMTYCRSHLLPPSPPPPSIPKFNPGLSLCQTADLFWIVV